MIDPHTAFHGWNILIAPGISGLQLYPVREAEAGGVACQALPHQALSMPAH